MTAQYVDLDTARAAEGTRLITSPYVPSPWSEAAKGLFALAGLPVNIVAKPRELDAPVKDWTGIDNVPVVIHEKEPPRASWAAIVGFVSRLAGPGVLLPVDPRARAADMGLIEMIAGEDGLGWTARLAMIVASFESNGAKGFPPPVAGFLAKRYGHKREMNAALLRERVTERLAVLSEALGDRTYIRGGDKPTAVDVYAAAFLTPLSDIDEKACPQLVPMMRKAFGSAAEMLGDLVPPSMWAHRTRMFERHLAWPIRLF